MVFVSLMSCDIITIRFYPILKSAHASDSCGRSIKSRFHRTSSRIPIKWSLVWSFPSKTIRQNYLEGDRFLKAQTTCIFDEILPYFLNRKTL